MVDPQYLFIVGVGRSGTTLLMSMLNAHANIVFPPEFHFISQHLATHSSATLNAALEFLRNDHRFSRLEIDLEEIAACFGSPLKPFSMSNLYKEILCQYARRKRNAIIIGDKAPKNIEYLPVLKRIFSEEKVIHVIRDPRDVYLSRTKAVWSANRSDISHYTAYQSQYILGRRQGSRLFSHNCLEIQYENLLTQTVVELEKICRFLQVPFDENMLNFNKSAHELVAQDELAWKKELFGPLLVTNLNKWKKELSSAQISRIESACFQVFEDGLYQSTQGRKKLSEKLFKSYMSFLSVLYRYYIKYINWKIIRHIS